MEEPVDELLTKGGLATVSRVRVVARSFVRPRRTFLHFSGRRTAHSLRLQASPFRNFSKSPRRGSRCALRATLPELGASMFAHTQI